MGYSDKDLFNSQYREGVPSADGNKAKSGKENSYTIGADNVNYYGSGGKEKVLIMLVLIKIWSQVNTI